MTDIQQKLWNIHLIVEDIGKFPQTYGTILQGEYYNGTYQIILRRKLNNLCKEGVICKAVIPGTRFGQVIYYCFPKKYHILVESSRIGSEVYCFFDYKKDGKFYIIVNECWQINDREWIKVGKKKFFEGNVLKFL